MLRLLDPLMSSSIAACPVPEEEETLAVMTEAFQIFQISRQCMLKLFRQGVNKHVLKAFSHRRGTFMLIMTAAFSPDLLSHLIHNEIISAFSGFEREVEPRQQEPLKPALVNWLS